MIIIMQWLSLALLVSTASAVDNVDRQEAELDKQLISCKGHAGKLLKIGFFSDESDVRHLRHRIWANAAAERINAFNGPACVQIYPLVEGRTPNETLCAALKNDVVAIISVASCSALYQLIPWSFENAVPHFVVDLGVCVKFPVKKKEHIFLDRTVTADISQAITDILSYNQVTDVIIIDDGKRGQGMASRLIEKLSMQLVRVSYVRINQTPLAMDYLMRAIRGKINSFGPATWRNKGLHLLSLVKKGLVDQIIGEMDARNILKPHLKVFQVDDMWQSNGYALDGLHDAPYWFDLRKAFLRRNFRPRMEVSLRHLVEAYVPETTVAYGDEAFVAAAVEATASAFISAGAPKRASVCREEQQTLQALSSLGNFSKLIFNELQVLGVIPEEIGFTLYRNFPYNSSKEQFLAVSEWIGNRWSYKEQTPSALNIISGKHIKIAAPNFPPYTRYYTTPKNTLAVDKQNLLLALISLLERHFNATYEILIPESGDWGVQLPGVRNWSGAVGMLLAREADIVPFLGLTGGRSEVVGFTLPVFAESVAMLVQAPAPRRSPFIFLKPFTQGTWAALLVAVPLVSLALKCINNTYPDEERNPRQSYGSCIWYIYGALLQQGGCNIPTSNSARMVLAFWWLSVLVLVATYIAMLIGYLAFDELSWRVASLDDFRSDTSPTIFLVKGGVVHEAITEYPGGDFAVIAERLRTKNKIELITPQTFAKERVISGEAVLIDSEGALAEIIRKDLEQQIQRGRYSCRLAIAPLKFRETFVAFGLRQGCPFTEALDHVLKLYFNTGITARWKNYIKPPTECSSFDKYLPHEPQITLNDVLGAHITLLLGLTFSVIILLLEALFNKLCSRCASAEEARLSELGASIDIAENNEILSEAVFPRRNSISSNWMAIEEQIGELRPKNYPRSAI